MDHILRRIPNIWVLHVVTHRSPPSRDQKTLTIWEDFQLLDNKHIQMKLFPYRNYRCDQDRAGCQQTRFDEWYNRQYSPNYNYVQPSPLVSIAEPDLSPTLIDLANIQSRSLDLMMANQKSQQDVYNELTRVNKDMANEAMFAAIETYDGTDGSKFEEWIDKIDQACRVSRRDFHTEIKKIKRSSM